MPYIYLTEEELILILVQALVQARKMSSRHHSGSPKIHVSIQGARRKKAPVVVYSHSGASEEAKQISQLKASIAEKHSSDSKAMSSYAVGHMMAAKKGGSVKALPHAGGVPLYKNGVLVGSVGISGDAPEVDEAIAHAAAKNFEAPSSIRSDVVLDIPFVGGDLVEEVAVSESDETFRLPSLANMSSSSALEALKRPESPSPASISKLPTLQSLSPPTPRSLPPLRSKSRSRSSSRIPSLPPSPTLSPLPKLKSSPLPSMKSSPLPKLKTSPLPPMKSSPLPKLKSSPLPPMKSSPLPPMKSSPLPPMKSSPLPPMKSSPLPPMKSSPKLSSLSSLAPSGMTSSVKLPPVVPSPKPLKSSTLPPLSKLTPLK